MKTRRFSRSWLLADELVERLRPERGFRRILLGALGGDDARLPRRSSRGPLRRLPELLQAGADQRVERAPLAEPRAAAATAPNASARR